MNGKPFDAFFKLKGKSFNSGLKKLESPNGMIELFESRDEYNRLDVYFAIKILQKKMKFWDKNLFAIGTKMTHEKNTNTKGFCELNEI
ncbi:hypothetical protein KSS87_009165 [Heliosperma pusillum]|nr:hypothetical protein KSS87_009165 [Heliosperma pusillum]